MKVTNQERIREFRGTSMQVFGGGTFTAVNLHVYVLNFTIDALAIVGATLKGENFEYDGTFHLSFTFMGGLGGWVRSKYGLIAAASGAFTC